MAEEAQMNEQRRWMVREVARIFFPQSRNPIRRLRCAVLGHRDIDILGPEAPICRWCGKALP